MKQQKLTRVLNEMGCWTWYFHSPDNCTNVFSFQVWTPILLVANPSMKVGTLNKEVSPVRIYYNGLAWWRPGDVFRTNCYPDIYKYPFDNQECRISILASGYTEEEVLLKSPDTEAFIPFYSDNGEWTILRTRTHSYDQNQLSVVQWYLTFKRRPQFFFFNVILPIIFLSLLNCLVYCIPVESGERISFAITVLLSFAVFMTLIGDNIPKTSAPMSLICYYLISIFSGSAMIMISTIFNLKLFYMNPKTAIPPRLKNLTSFVLKRRCCGGKRNINPETTVIQVIGKQSENVGLNNEKKGFKDWEPEVVPHDQDEFTWKEVAHAVDKLSIIGFILYFTLATVSHLVIIIF